MPFCVFCVSKNRHLLCFKIFLCGGYPSLEHLLGIFAVHLPVESNHFKMKQLICLAFLPFLLGNSETRPGKDYAVFFYVTQFQPGWQGLPDTKTEAETLKTELESNYGFVGKLVPNPTLQKILD